MPVAFDGVAALCSARTCNDVLGGTAAAPSGLDMLVYELVLRVAQPGEGRTLHIAQQVLPKTFVANRRAGILVFLPGIGEISELQEHIGLSFHAPGFELL